MLDHIFNDRYKWQEETFNLLKSDLLSVKDNRFIQYSHRNSSHLVCLYGESQVGKTTLILNMIGIKDEECKRNVSKVLRGGVAKGNSSTSTAIVYSQSESGDKYGISVETLEGRTISPYTDYSPEDMIAELQSVRDKVEKNIASDKGILHIFIPKKYFSEATSKTNISILDLPGIGSRNRNEESHVASLMNRYIPISSVCIVVCLFNEIQSLEPLELPNGIDWKNQPHKFLIVSTRAFSNGQVKSYFSNPRELRKKGFNDYIKETAINELETVLGKNNKTEIFPLEIGDSFEQLLSNELHDEADCREVRDTRNSILSALHDVIIKTDGDKLLSAIKDLRSIVEHSNKDKISSIEKEIEECNGKLKDLRKSKCEEIKKKEELELILQEQESESKKFNDLSRSTKEVLRNTSSKFTQKLIEKVNETIKNKELLTKDSYLNDPKQLVLRSIADFLLSELKTIYSKAQSLMDENNLKRIEDHTSSTKIYNQFTREYQDELYPQTNILNRLIGNKYKKIHIKRAYTYIYKIDPIIQSVIETDIIKQCVDKINHKLNDIKVTISSFESKIIGLERRKESFENEICKIEAEIKGHEENKKGAETQQEKDQQTLNTYLEYAEKAYMCQRSEVVKKINSNITPSEKLLHVLFLGVIDNDYKTIIDVSNG